MIFASFNDICMSRLQTLGSITCDQHGSKRWKAATNCLYRSRGLGVPKQPIGRVKSHATHGPLECVPTICVPQRHYKGGASSAGEHGKGQQQAHFGHRQCYTKKYQFSTHPQARRSRAALDRKDGAALLKENQLYALFPTIDRHFLQDIFRDHK